MILIFSDDFDFTTHEVCKWLSFYKQKYFLITNTNKIIDVEVQIGIEKIIILKTSNDEIINLKNIKTYWYRRGRFFYDKENRFQTRDYFDEKIINEWEIVNDYLMSNFINNDYFNKKVNKLAVLEISKKLGFIIPKTIITSNKSDLLNYFGNRRIISKPIGDVVNYQKEETIYSSVTCEIFINDLKDNFFASLFQELIIKKYEIRVFVFNNKCYSTAIFSQLDEETRIDYRNYNYLNPNRQVTFKLPNTIEKKIFKLLKKLNLNSGSIDLIYGVDNVFYFLEINPIGQFGSLSLNCNYYCEKIIAESLLILK